MNYETFDRTIHMKLWTLNHLCTGRTMNFELGTSTYWQSYELGLWNFCLLA